MSRSGQYVPERGDIIWVDFTECAQGHEQKGRRPAIVLSTSDFHERLGIAIVCPITSKQKDFPFEIPLPSGLTTYGVILTDQLRSIDWVKRNASFQERAPDDLVCQVLDYVRSFLS